jgi:hypothetical protein
MRGLLIVALLTCASTGVLVEAAHADAMRCGRKLVRSGDGLDAVQKSCGPPNTASRRVERSEHRVADKHGNVVLQTTEVTIDEWSYDFGPHEFVQRLTFENGKLVRVVAGEYGASR